MPDAQVMPHSSAGPQPTFTLVHEWDIQASLIKTNISMTTNDLIIASLELVAKKAGDITTPVYEHYFSKCPESRDLMSHIDKLVQGKMLDEVFRLLMTEDYATENVYLLFEVKTHQQSYGVLKHMYNNLLDAVQATVREALDGDWNSEFESAWRERTDSLLKSINAYTV